MNITWIPHAIHPTIVEDPVEGSQMKGEFLHATTVEIWAQRVKKYPPLALPRYAGAMNAEDNPNPVVYDGGQTIHFRSLQELLEITDLQDELSSQEIFESLRHLTDPEHPNLSLEQLKVVEAGHVWVNEDTSTVFVRFTPTVPTCSVATLIGLTIKAKLLRSLPQRFKVDVEITPGTHNTEDQVNKQLADKERVAAALENPALRNLINNGIAGTDKPDISLLLT